MTRIRLRRQAFIATICAHIGPARVARIKKRAAYDGISFERELYRVINQGFALR